MTALDTTQPPYNIKADGKTDNAVGVAMIREGFAGKQVDLLFPDDKRGILSSDNRWLAGIAEFKIINGVFRAITDDDDEAKQRPFFPGEMLQNNALEKKGDKYNGEKKYVTADRFASVKAGSNVIPLLTSINKFPPGDRVCLYFDNDFDDSSYPPPTIAEFRKVKGIDGKNIILDFPVERNYYDDVLDNPYNAGGGSGLPRIINLDRKENVYCRSAEFINVTFGNAVKSNGESWGKNGNLTFPAQRLRVIGGKCEDNFWPSENEEGYYGGGLVVEGQAEFDKMGWRVICDGVKFLKQVTGGGSINEIFMNNCYGAESFQLNSRYLEYNNCHTRSNSLPDKFRSAISTPPAKNPMRRVVVNAHTFSSGSDSMATAHIDKFPFSSLTIDEVEGNNIILNDFSLVKQIEAGTTMLFNEDGSNFGLVRKKSYNGRAHVIVGGWINQPKKGEKWMFSYVKEVIDKGGHRVLDNKLLWDGNSIRWKGNTNSNDENTIHLTQDDFTGNRIIDIYGNILSITSVVRKSAPIEIQVVDPFEQWYKIGQTFKGRKWVKQLYLIGTGGSFEINIERKQF